MNKTMIILVFVILVLSVICPPAYGESGSYAVYSEITYEGSAQYGYKQIRIASANDTPVDVNTRTWSQVSSDVAAGKAIELHPGVAYPVLSIYAHAKDGNDANTGAFHLRVLSARVYGGWKTVFDCNVGIGSAALSHNPDSNSPLKAGAADPNYRWADEMTGIVLKIPEGHFQKSGYEADGDILEVSWDGEGNRYFMPEITGCDWTKIDYVYLVLSGMNR